jgi:hypothetical protein
MYQNPPLYAPGPPVVHATVRRRRSLTVMLLLPFLVFGLAFFGGSYAIAPEPDIEVLPGFAFVAAGGRDVLLVPYERRGPRGMFQTMTQDEFQVRLAALDPATGESLWDTQMPAACSVLAGGRQYAYLATDSGLVIVAMADGAVVAEGADGFLAARSAYAYDPEGRQVLAMNTRGDVLAIPLDQTKATPVDAPTAAAWSGRLSTEPAGPPETTAQEALTPDGERIVLRELPFAGLGKELVRVTADGRPIAVGGTAFQGAGLVVASGAALGASGQVLVQHLRSINDTGLALSMVLLDNNQVTTTLPVDHAVIHAVLGQDGTAAVATGPDLVLVRDGQLTRVALGATNFFGSPS